MLVIVREQGRSRMWSDNILLSLLDISLCSWVRGLIFIFYYRAHDVIYMHIEKLLTGEVTVSHDFFTKTSECEVCKWRSKARSISSDKRRKEGIGSHKLFEQRAKMCH
jgi:hypothetical protein